MILARNRLTRSSCPEASPIPYDDRQTFQQKGILDRFDLLVERMSARRKTISEGADERVHAQGWEGGPVPRIKAVLDTSVLTRTVEESQGRSTPFTPSCLFQGQVLTAGERVV